jgi:hypothetical protein
MKRDIAIALVVCALALWQNLADVPVTPFNPDESRWLHRAHYLRAALDPRGPTWDDGYLTRGQPPLGSYLMGVGLLLQGRDLTTNGSWLYTCQEGTCRPGFDELAHNRAAGNIPAAADLEAGRRTSAAVGALTAVAVFFLGKRLSNRVGGAVGALLLAAHPFQAYVASLATADALLGLLLALAALAAARLADRPTWPRALLLGALLGLGGATKLSPLLAAVPLAGLGAALLAAGWRRRNETERWSLRADRLAPALLATPLVAFLAFVAVNPYLWPDPIGRTVDLFAFRAQEMQHQGADWPVLAVPSRADAFRRVGVNLGTRWDATGRALEAGLERLDVAVDVPPLDLPLALVGLELMIALAVWRGPRGPHALVLVLLGGQVAITIAGMRSAFDRYHVPMALFVAVSVGLLAGQGAVALRTVAVRLAARDRRLLLPGPRPRALAGVPVSRDAVR